VFLASHCYSPDTYFREITPFAFQSDTPGVIRELKLAYFPVIYSMSLATPPVSDALGNSKGVMSPDLDVSLHCHCNLPWQCQGRYLSSGGVIVRGSNSASEDGRLKEKVLPCLNNR
jgi:hypothetical protein